MNIEGDLKRVLYEVPLTDEQRDFHKDAGESFHVPVIVHRTGGVSAQILNACGICGAQIIQAEDSVWIPISDQLACKIRELRGLPPKHKETTR